MPLVSNQHATSSARLEPSVDCILNPLFPTLGFQVLNERIYCRILEISLEFLSGRFKLQNKARNWWKEIVGVFMQNYVRHVFGYSLSQNNQPQVIIKNLTCSYWNRFKKANTSKEVLSVVSCLSTQWLFPPWNPAIKIEVKIKTEFLIIIERISSMTQIQFLVLWL